MLFLDSFICLYSSVILNKNMIKTIFDYDFKIISDDYEFKYQESLTKKLDSSTEDFSQEKLNEIVLWKVNRYAEFDKSLLTCIFVYTVFVYSGSQLSFRNVILPQMPR